MSVIDDLLGRLEQAPVVPLVVPDNAETAIKTTQALVDGGLTVIEVVLRTETAIIKLSQTWQQKPLPSLKPSGANHDLVRWLW